jgi:predicted house-cleaning noncanonical NTP pyrophosphatase (MazG superfamily)
MITALQYFNPQIHDINDELSSFNKFISDGKLMGNLLGLPAINKPAFILGSPGKKASSFDFFVYYLPEENPALISKSIQYYLSTLVIPPPKPAEAITTTEKRVYIQASAGNRNFTKINKDADELFDDVSSALTNQLREEVESELVRNKSKGAVSILLHVINRMKALNMATDPNLVQLVNKLENEEDVKLSRLFVPVKGNIKLLDYDLEIPLSHLDKALYIFFLLHEEGIQFKYLGNYKYELTKLYAKVTNRVSKVKFKKSMDDLCNPFSNSINEKCSRIRRVFVVLLDERIAKNYYITKGRNKLKQITLDRSLVVFEDENLYS